MSEAESISMADESALAGFGEFVAATDFARLPREAVEAAKLRILDLFAAALNGYRVGTWRPVAGLLADQGETTVWGSGRRSSLRDAVLLNGFLAHATYVEDGSRFTGGHPSSATIPAAVGVAESRGASGSDLIAATIVGYEVFLRLGRAIYPAVVKRGFQSTAVLAPIASAAASAYLLKLDAAQTAHAMAIAANAAGGLKEALKDPGSQPLQVGRGGEAGVTAALLAAQGVTGVRSILENAFFRAFADGATTAGLLDEIGRNYAIDQTYIKIHGGCRGIHAPADCLRELLQREKIEPARIKAVRIWTDTVTRAADIDDPETVEQAQFSIRFSAAAQFVFGDVSTFRFSKENLASPAVHALMPLVSVAADPTFDAAFPDKRSARVEIETDVGRVFDHFLDNARGEPEHPFSRPEVEAKFLAMATPVLGARAQAVAPMVAELESAPDLRALIAAFSVRG